MSRLRVPAAVFEGHDGSVSRACRAFPAAGMLVALGPALIVCLVATPDTALLAAFLSLGAMTLLTGALHEDGLADCADGLFGGRDREHALAIMKDSRVGSYGVIALVLSFGIRASALASIATIAGAAPAAAALLAAAAVSRGLMIWHWFALPAARASGAAVAAGRPLESALVIALASSAVLSLILLPAGFSLATLVLALAFAGCACLLFNRFVSRTLGGHTGDTIGAAQQITETALLCALAVSL